MGSGTTAKLSIQLGRNWIGSELDEKYSNICNRRLENIVYDESIFNEYITKETLK
jgi:DNA modification methylase